MERNPDGLEKRPLIGLGVLIVYKLVHTRSVHRILLGERIGSHGTGEWCCPGGSLEFGETIFEGAKREVYEETGMAMDTLELISVCDEMRYIVSHDKHYVDIGILAHMSPKCGVPRVMEPHKCRQWKWFDILGSFPPLMESTTALIENYKNETLYRPLSGLVDTFL